MRKDDRVLRILLVSDSPERVDSIRRLMTNHGLRAELFAVRPSRKAVAIIRGDGRLQPSTKHDLVLLDFAERDEQTLPHVSKIAFEAKPGQSPVVMLTSAESEGQLAVGPHADIAAQLFEPMRLVKFVNKMRQHAPGRFLHALGVIGKFGPVLVRLPGFVADAHVDRGIGFDLTEPDERKVA